MNPGKMKLDEPSNLEDHDCLDWSTATNGQGFGQYGDSEDPIEMSGEVRGVCDPCDTFTP